MAIIDYITKSSRVIKEEYMTYDIILVAVCQNGMALEFAPDHLKDKNVYYEAISQNPMAMKFVNDSSEDMNHYAVKKNGLSIKYISNPSEKTCNWAIKNNPRSLLFIRNPSEKAFKSTMKRDGLLLKYIHPCNQSYKLCLRAVNQNPDALEYVNDHWMWLTLGKYLNNLK